MWFEKLSLVLGLTLITKSLIGLVFHQRFYRWDQAQYSQENPSVIVKLFLLYGITFTGLTLYATAFHYTEHGWVITVTSIVMTVKIYQLIRNWKSFSKNARKFINHNKLNTWVLDLFTLTAGLLFLTLAFTLYGTDQT